MSNTNSTLKYFVPFGTLKYQKHHSMPFGNMVLCDGSREGTLINYLPKKAKIERCAQCLHFGAKHCNLGYHVFANSKPCKQGTLRSKQKP